MRATKLEVEGDAFMGIVQAADGLRYAERYVQSNSDLQEALGFSAIDNDFEMGFLGHGEHNRNFWLKTPDGRKFVLRINVVPQPFHKDQVAYEYGALRTLRSSGVTPQPIYLDNTHKLIEEGALVISYCEGEELNYDNMGECDLEKAAKLMATYHAVPVEEDCPIYRPQDPLRSLFDECVQRFKVYLASDAEDPRLTRWTERFIKAAQPMLDVPFSQKDANHIISTETLPSHFLLLDSDCSDSRSGSFVNEDRGRRPCCYGIESGDERPGYFVDWERPIIGEVAQDLAYFTAPTTTFWDSEYLMPADKADEVVETYWQAVDGRFTRGSFDARYRAYRAMTALRSTTWCCKALLTYRPGSQAHTTSKTERKLPVYLSDEFMERIAAECFGL